VFQIYLPEASQSEKHLGCSANRPTAKSRGIILGRLHRRHTAIIEVK